MKWILIALLPFSMKLFAQPAVDGYMRGAGNLDIAAGATFETYSQYFQSLNETGPISRTSIAGSLYGAYGIAGWLDAQINVPYIVTSGDFSDFQDMSAYVKASVFDFQVNEKRSLKIMLAAGTSFPMSEYETESVYSIGQQATAYDGRIVVQCTRTSGFFIMLQGGYTYRLDPVPSSYPAALKVGMAASNYYFDVWYDQQIAIGGTDYAGYRTDTSSTKSFREFGVSYGKLGVTFYKPFFSSSGFSASASYVLWGRNVGQAIGLSVSLVHRFKFKSE